MYPLGCCRDIVGTALRQLGVLTAVVRVRTIAQLISEHRQDTT